MTEQTGPTKKVIIRKKKVVRSTSKKTGKPLKLAKKALPIKHGDADKPAEAAPPPLPEPALEETPEREDASAQNGQAEEPSTPAPQKKLIAKKKINIGKKTIIKKKIASPAKPAAPVDAEPPLEDKPETEVLEEITDEETTGDKPETFRFACSGCGEEIPARVDRAGKKMSCPICEQNVTIPDPGVETETEEAEPPKAEDPPKPVPFKFYCVYCGQKLSATKSHIGKFCVCPTCKNELQIPEPKPIPEFE
jgi:hypothetical protein